MHTFVPVVAHARKLVHALALYRRTSLNDTRPSPTSTPRPRLYQEPTLLPIS